MKFKTFLSGVGIMMMSTQAIEAAPVEYSTTGHYFDLIAGPVISWDDARAAAISMGGYLATITDAAENAFLTSQYNTQAWIGGTDVASEGNWIWADGPEAGMALTYTNWRAGDPNNGSNLEHYLHFLGDQGGTWVDSVSLVGLGTFIVEWDSDPTSKPPTPAIPLPASLPLLLGALGLLALRSRIS